MLCEILLFLAIVWMIISRWQRRHLIKLSKHLKNDYTSYPLLGHAYLSYGNDEDHMTGLKKIGLQAIKHGGLSYAWLANELIVVVADPQVIDTVSKACLEKYYVMKFLGLLIGNGTLIAPVPIWRQRRKIVSAVYNQKNINYFVNNIISKHSSIMVTQLRDVAGTGNFSFWDFIITYTFNSICEMALGVQLNAELDSDQQFLKAFDKSCQLVAARMCQPWLHNISIYKLLPYYRDCMKSCQVLTDFMDQVIFKFRETETYEANDISTNNKFKLLMEQVMESSGRSYTNLELREELLVLLLAATDTSAVGAAFTAVMLSKHPKVQDKVYQELHEVFGESDRPIVAEDIARLKYLDAVIKETMRLYPPVPISMRKVEEDLQLPSGITLVKGAGVCLHIWAMHRNPQYWGKDAELFRPERFFNTPLKHPATYLPFSFGPRNCPGHKYAMSSMKAALASILREYQIVSATRTDATETEYSENCINESLRVKFDVMMKDVDGFKIQIKSRV